jgi:hypothetical protein
MNGLNVEILDYARRVAEACGVDTTGWVVLLPPGTRDAWGSEHVVTTVGKKGSGS